MYYFCSTKLFKDGTILYPRIPETTMNSENKTTPRVCIACSIDGCLTGICAIGSDEIVYVYQCELEESPYHPTLDDVIDSPFSGELWALKPVKLTRFMDIKTTGWLERDFDGMTTNIYLYDILNHYED